MLEKQKRGRPLYTIYLCPHCRGQFEVGSMYIKAPSLSIKYCPFCGAIADKEQDNIDMSIPARVGRYIADLLAKKPKFHGNVKVNFNSGGLSNCVKTESEKI